MNWPPLPLSEVVIVNPRPIKTADATQMVSFVTMDAVSKEGFLLGEKSGALPEMKKGFMYFEKGDVLLAKTPPCFEHGKSLRAGQIANQIGFASTEFHVLRANPERIDSTYLFYMLWSNKFRSMGEASMSGASGKKQVGEDFLKNVEIPLPPLAEQKRIAALLDKADTIRRKRQQAVQLADTFLHAVFLDIFGDPVTNPKGWEVKPLKQLANITTGNTPSRKETKYYGDHIEWMKSDNINAPSHFLSEASEYLSQEGEKVGRVASEGSTLVTCIAGHFGSISHAAYTDRNVAFNQQIGALTPLAHTTSGFLYVLILLSGKHIQSASTKSIKGILNKEKMAAIPMICPPLFIQEKFQTTFLKFLSLHNNLISCSRGASDAFMSLSQRAFSGQL